MTAVSGNGLGVERRGNCLGRWDLGSSRVPWVTVLAAQIVLLILAGIRNADALNTDAIAYLQLAMHYAEGQTELMVSGYWGPLISWLLAPLIAMGAEPMLAARIVMAVSAIVFAQGCRVAFRAFGLDVKTQFFGFVLASLISVFWSVRNITPDLLLAAFVALAVAALAVDRWQTSRKSAALSGVLWGVAYWAKAIAFPLALAVTFSFAALRALTRMSDWKTAARQWLITMAGFAVVASPWMITLSLKYGSPTFSTSGAINHAIAGPADVERYHPFARIFHEPEEGRVTQWEDPSVMKYHPWSPFESKAYAAHQLGIVSENIPKILNLFSGVDVIFLAQSGGGLAPRDIVKALPGFDVFYFAMAGMIGCLIVCGGWRERLAKERWRWAVIPVAFMAGAYLPVFLLADDQRYFYPAYPFLWIGAVGTLGWLKRRYSGESEIIGRMGIRLVAGSFALPAMLWALVALVGIPNAASRFSQDVVERIKRADLAGPVAGSALMQGGRAGIYCAWFLQEPWRGDSLEPTAEDIASSRARLMILHRMDPTRNVLEGDGRFRNVDSELFSSPDEAARFPLVVYELQGWKTDRDDSARSRP